MLFTPAKLVSTKVGVAGLPREVASCFSIHNDETSFTEAILNALHSHTLQGDKQNEKLRNDARLTFSDRHIHQVISSIVELQDGK